MANQRKTQQDDFFYKRSNVDLREVFSSKKQLKKVKSSLTALDTITYQVNWRDGAGTLHHVQTMQHDHIINVLGAYNKREETLKKVNELMGVSFVEWEHPLNDRDDEEWILIFKAELLRRYIAAGQEQVKIDNALDLVAKLLQ